MIYKHPHPYTPLLAHLQSHLPNSGPLLHHIQYQLSHPSTTGHILATSPPDQLPQHATDPWLAAYVDIYNGNQTQVWVFSTLESSPAENESKSSQKEREETRSQLLKLFSVIRTELIPPYVASLAASTDTDIDTATPDPNSKAETKPENRNENENEEEEEEKIKQIKPHPPTSFLVGSLHTALLSLILDLSNGPSPKVRLLRGYDVRYVKYYFDLASLVGKGATRSELGTGEEGIENDADYRFHSLPDGKVGLQPHQAQLVISRTHIPRSVAWLLAAPSVVLYDSRTGSVGELAGAGVDGDGGEGEEEKEMPIAWGFLGADGSLCSLHVEKEHRGKGLGLVVGREVMRLGTGSGSGDGGHGNGSRCGWGFADVAVENGASRRVMEKMGGKVGWEVVWVVVDVI